MNSILSCKLQSMRTLQLHEKKYSAYVNRVTCNAYTPHTDVRTEIRSPCKVRCSRKHSTCLKFVNEHLNDSEENWVKVLWSDETKIELAGINSTHCVWRRRNAAYDPRTPSPLSKMEVETLCFGGVFLLRGQNNCTASRDDERGHVASGPVHWNGLWMGPVQHENDPKHTAKATRSGSREEHWDPGVAYPVSRP